MAALREYVSARPHPRPAGATTRIAVPVTGGGLSTHFGHSEQFAIFEVGGDGKSVVSGPAARGARLHR